MKYFIQKDFQEGFSEIYRFDLILRNFFEKINNFTSILIPSKRSLEAYSQVNLTETFLSPDGNGIINILFKYKNKSEDSDERKIYNKIHKEFHKITGMYFDIHPHDNYVSVYFKDDPKAEGLRSDQCGLGLADVLIMITLVIASNVNFVFIEEPENHIHPDMQRKFFHFLAAIKSKQFILSTHSSIFLNPYLADQIYYVENNNNDISVTNQTSKSEILYSLGYSVADNLVSDFVLLTEGPTDIPILETILTWLNLTQKYNIRYWPLGGDNMEFLDLSIFKETYNVAALVDSDPGSSVQRTRFIRKCQDNGIKVHKLERYSIENYFTADALKKVFPELDIQPLNSNLKIDNQYGFNTLTKPVKYRNREIINHMSLDDLEGTDLFLFCQDIGEMIKQAFAE